MPEPIACRRSREGLTEYLENALSPRRRQGLEAHLASCPACRGHLSQVEMLRSIVAGMPGESVPAPLKEILLRSFREERSD